MKIRMSIAALALTGTLTTPFLFAQSGLPGTVAGGVEVQMILTAADHVSHNPPALKAADVSIMSGTITSFTPLQNAQSGLELYVVMDDVANYNFSSKLAELRKFIAARPAQVAVGVAYIHEGALQIVQTPTTDRAKATHALRAPVGSKSANPYCAVSDLIRQWPAAASEYARREIILVSTGIDDSINEGALCINAETAIHDAQRAGVVIYALYNPVADYLSQKWSKVDSGVVNLAHVCYETGGEAYFLTHNPVESIEPFLSDISEHLAHQYRVTLRMPAGLEGLRPIYIDPASADYPRLELMVPESVWVAAPASSGP